MLMVCCVALYFDLPYTEKMFKKVSNGRLYAFRTTYLYLRFKTSSVKTTTLSNGLKVVTEERNSPLVCSSLFIKTGARFEKSRNQGITLFIEHMAYQGFTSLNKNCLEEALLFGGSKMSALTTRDYQVFSIVGLTGNVSQNVSLLSRVVTQLELSECEIELQKHQMCLEAIENDDNNKVVLFDYLHQTAFQETPLAHSVVGPTSNICAFNLEDLFCYLKQNYRPHRMVLATSGGVSHSQILETAENCFGVISNTVEQGLPLGPQRYTGSSITFRDDSLPFAHVAIAVEAPGYNSPEYLPLLLASCLNDSWERTQGGACRHGSYLARAASTDNLCERFESFYIAYQDVGLWGIYFVGSKELDNMVYNIQNQWMNICTTTHKTDVQRACNLLKLKLAKNVDGVMNSSFDIGLQMMYTDQHKSLEDLYSALSKITDATVRKVASKYIYDKCPVLAAVGPIETLPDYNGIRSGMYWLRL